MPTALSPATIALVKATVPALAEHGKAITLAMYARLFEDEAVRVLFNHSNQGENGTQIHALSAAILGYAQNIENVGALASIVERIAQKHIGYHILPEHYPYVARALLGAIKDVLGDVATAEILAAWGEAYWFLAEIMKGREAEIRGEIESIPGGWHGWRRFIVAKKVRESAIITSFIIRPEDGGPVLSHKAGQYLTFHFDVPGQAPLKRTYSISSAANGRTYRISVKRETHGLGSGWLHDSVNEGDVILATPPAGDFFLSEAPEHPIVLLSGGVGLTPMVSMLETIAERHPGLETYYVHGTLNSTTHAMDAHVRAIAARHGATRVSTFYEAPCDSDAEGLSHDVTGRISLEWLRRKTPLDTADFYLCGPKPFLRFLVSDLMKAGVSQSRIHYEFFGPADVLLAA